MKNKFKLVGTAVIMMISSCSKNGPAGNYVPAQGSPSPPAPVTFAPGFVIVGNTDYFWGHPWQKTSRGYEIHLDTWRLTDSAIKKGVTVRLAPWTEMTTFDIIPSTIYDFDHHDSIHLNYVAIPGQLQVIANASFDIRYVSDVSILYN